jgi:RNase P protein component
LSREAYRLIRNSLKPGFDLVLLLYPGESSFNTGAFSNRMEQLKILFQKAALLLLVPEEKSR